MISNKFKRQMDDWIDKGICVRHKYINAIFRFLWKLIKKSIVGIVLSFLFILGLILYKSIKNKE